MNRSVATALAVAAALAVGALALGGLGWRGASAQPAQSSAPTIGPEWAFPDSPTSEPTIKRVTVVNRFLYRESKFVAAPRIEAIDPKSQRYATPEEAFVSRVSAMMRKDFEWYLSTWTDEARQRFEEKNAREGHGEGYWIQWWDDTFRFGRFELVRKIETDATTIVTYRQVSEDGTDMGGFEFPSLMERKGERWLSKLPGPVETFLVQHSPWVSGESTIEMVVR